MSRQVTLTDSEAKKRLNAVNRELAKRGRERRRLRNEATHQSYWDNLPDDTRQYLLANLTDPDFNMREIAKEVGYSHAFIVYVWRNHT